MVQFCVKDKCGCFGRDMVSVLSRVADFDREHVRRAKDALACLTGLSIVGSLDSNCNVHELATKLRCFLQTEVVGQWNEPSFDAGHHHWSKPHLTLAKLLYA